MFAAVKPTTIAESERYTTEAAVKRPKHLFAKNYNTPYIRIHHFAKNYNTPYIRIHHTVSVPFKNAFDFRSAFQHKTGPV